MDDEPYHFSYYDYDYDYENDDIMMISESRSRLAMIRKKMPQCGIATRVLSKSIAHNQLFYSID